MSVERWAGYNDELKSARESQPKEGIKSRRERVKLFRMELMLDNAQCARLLVQYFENNPYANADELEKFIQQSGKIVHPEAVQEFINFAIKTHRQILNVIRTIGKTIDFKYGTKDMGKSVYKSVAGGVAPEGIVELDAEYPLALYLKVFTDSDFHRIDSRKNIGGFYKEKNPILMTICQAGC